MNVELPKNAETNGAPSTTPADAVNLREPSTVLPRLKTHLPATVCCLALAFGLYWPALGFDFVNWDDPWYVINNELIKSWHPANLYRLATQIAIKNYAPITMFSYLLDHTLWGMQPGGYHFTNIVLHALNAALVYFLIRQVTGNGMIGWTAAALFAAHPIQIETVAWISSRKGLLSATFILASLICWLRTDRRPKHDGYGLLFLALALLSKAIAVVVPVIVLLYDMIVRRRSFSVALAHQIVPGVVAILLLLVTMTAQSTLIGGLRGHMELNKLQIIAVDSVILWKYIGMLIAPTKLCVLYDPSISGITGPIALSFTGWLVVAAVVYWKRQELPLVALGVLSFFVFLLPVLNFFPITTLMNDRYLYLPSIPLFALVGGGLWRGSQLLMKSIRGGHASAFPHHGNRLAPILGAVVLVFCYGRMTQFHLPVWQDGMSLWRHAMLHVPQLPVVQIQLADALYAEGRNAEAISLLEKVLAEGEPDELDRNRIVIKLENWRQQTVPPAQAEV